MSKITRETLLAAGWLTWTDAEAQGVERVWIRPTPDSKFDGKFYTFEEAVQMHSDGTESRPRERT